MGGIPRTAHRRSEGFCEHSQLDIKMAEIAQSAITTFTVPARTYSASIERAVRRIKSLIWIYFALLLFEGALRKWVIPGLATPLLVVRDPVLLGAYALALHAGLFPQN